MIRLNNSNIKTFLLASVSLALLSSCAEKEKAEAPKEEEDSHQVFKVATVVAKVVQKYDQIEIPGIVAALPDHSIKVSPAMAGKLISILPVPGSRVLKGELIASLDDTHLQEVLSQSKTAVDTANVALKQAKNNLDFANENVQRQKKMFDAEVSAKKDMVTAESQVTTAQSQIDAAKSQLHSAQTVVRQNETELGFTKVHSPISGIVANRFLNVGDSTDTNNPILQIIDLDRALVNAQIPVESSTLVYVGANATISASATYQSTAKITSISPAVDAQTNTVRVQLECANKNLMLKDGEQVIVTVKGKTAHSVILLPKTALVPSPDDQKKQMVYVIEGKKAHRIFVSKRNTSNDEVEIVSGLKSGQKVIAKDAYGLPDDCTVDETGKPR